MTWYAEFAGGRAGTGPLNWGQRGIWKAIEELAPDDHWLNLRSIVDTPRRRPTDLAGAVAAVGRLVERHESLRTRIRAVDGEPVQDVAAAGRLPVEVVEDTDGAAALADRLAAAPFDYAGEWPLRVGLVVTGGVVHQVVLVLSHAVADRHGADIVARDLRLLLLRGELPTPAGPQPLDLAASQRRDERGHTAAAVEYWTRTYARLPRTGLPLVAAAAAPPYRRILLTSPALADAARDVAARCGIGAAGSGTVLLAAVIATIGRHTGHDTVGMLTIVGNRHQAAHRDLVSSMGQLALLAVEVGDKPDLDSLSARTWQAARTAYRHAYYDQAALDAALAGTGRGTGGRPDPQSCFNDIRTPGSVPGSGAARGVEWEEMDTFNWQCFVELRDAPGGLCLALAADTRCFPPPAMERFVHDVEAMVVEAA